MAEILEQLQQAINVGVGVPSTRHDIEGQSGDVTQRMDAAQQDGCGDGKRYCDSYCTSSHLAELVETGQIVRDHYQKDTTDNSNE